MESANAATDDRGRSPEDMQALLLEYDAADFRGRHDLLDREGLSIRDVARWRREIARQVADGEAPLPNPRPAKKNVPVVLDDPAAPTPQAAPAPQAEQPATAADGDAAEAETDATGQPRAGRGRSRRPSEGVTSPDAPGGPMSALRSDVVAAHASALVYHADALSRLIADAPKTPGDRRRTNAIDRLTDAARQTSAAAREVLSIRRRSGVSDTPTRDAVDVSAELTDMLSTLTDYSSLAVAVQLLARELNPAEDLEPARTRRPAPGERNRRPWWGAAEEEPADDEAAPAQPRERHTWGAKRTVS